MMPTYKLSMCNTYKINLCLFPFVAITYWVCFSLTYTCDWEKAMAPHSSTLAWKIPWTEEPGRLQSMGSLGVGHNWATSLSLFTFMHWRRKWQPTPVFLPGESQDGGAWWAAVYGVAQSQTRLKWLSSSSSSSSNSLITSVKILSPERLCSQVPADKSFRGPTFNLPQHPGIHPCN